MSRRRQQTALRKTGGSAGPFRGTRRWHVPKKSAEQERPSPAAKSGKDRGYTAGRSKARGTGRKGPCFDRACKEVSARACWKRPITPQIKYNNSNARYGCVPSRVRRGAFTRCTAGSTEVTFCGKRANGCAGTEERQPRLHDSKEAEHSTESAHAFMQRWPSPKAMKRIRERVHELTGSRHSGKDVEQIIAALNPVLRGWGNYLRTGNAERKFNQLDSYVWPRLTRWMVRRGGQRTGRFEKWTRERFFGMGLYQLRGSVKYPTQATPVRSSLSRVRENRTHGLKGGVRNGLV